MMELIKKWAAVEGPPIPQAHQLLHLWVLNARTRTDKTFVLRCYSWFFCLFRDISYMACGEMLCIYQNIFGNDKNLNLKFWLCFVCVAPTSGARRCARQGRDYSDSFLAAPGLLRAPRVWDIWTFGRGDPGTISSTSYSDNSCSTLIVYRQVVNRVSSYFALSKIIAAYLQSHTYPGFRITRQNCIKWQFTISVLPV